MFRFRSAAPAGRGRSRCRSRRTTPRRRTWRGDPCPRRSSGQTPSCRDRPDPDLRRGAIYRDFSGSSLRFPLRRFMNEINWLDCVYLQIWSWSSGCLCFSEFHSEREINTNHIKTVDLTPDRKRRGNNTYVLQVPHASLNRVKNTPFIPPVTLRVSLTYFHI